MRVGKAIEEFAERMQTKIDKNRYKRDSIMNPNGRERKWSHCTPEWLLYRLRQETLELEEAIMNEDPEAVRDEAADVGNFAMMIHDNINQKERDYENLR